MVDTVYFGSQDDTILYLLVLGTAVYMAFIGRVTFAILLLGAMVFLNIKNNMIGGY